MKIDHALESKLKEIKTFEVPVQLTVLSLMLVIIGFAMAWFGMMQNPTRGWGNILICNYYFLSLMIGAAFFAAIQNISQSGWSAMFKRIPEALTGPLPVIALFIMAMIAFGTHSLYHWSHEVIVRQDQLLQHKAPYLNFTFYIIRATIFLVSWIILTTLLRRLSLKEDSQGGMVSFIKSEFYSKVLIFVLALTFSLATFDWIMSIDAHWFSTIFAVKNFVSAFYHASAAIILLVVLLYKRGHLPILKDSHLHDFSRYLFILSMIWGYMWFSQYFLMWFSNIPEETVYYSLRLGREWKTLFLLDLGVNWLFPFLFLLSNKIAKNINALMFTSSILLVGFWLDIYLQVMPGLTGVNAIGAVELGTFIGFYGLFIWLVAKTLGRANIIPKKHPYLMESALHESH